MYQIPISKTWVICPHCRKKQNIIYENVASCCGVLLKCKHCKAEFELRIVKGMQK